jgi:hypothetical protein
MLLLLLLLPVPVLLLQEQLLQAQLLLLRVAVHARVGREARARREEMRRDRAGTRRAG